MFGFMQKIGRELQRRTKAFSIEGPNPSILDFCMAPGGFVSYAILRNPTSEVHAFTLNPEHGGHQVLIDHDKDDSRIRVRYEDITMFASEFGIDMIPKDHPERLQMDKAWPYEAREYDLIICDGQTLRTQDLSESRREREPVRLTNAQLFLGLKRIKPGGTMIVLLHKAHAMSTFRIVHTFSGFSHIKLYKPTAAHRQRSSFYMVARGVQPTSKEGAEALEIFKNSWINATFPVQSSELQGLEDISTSDMQRILDCFGPKFVGLALPVWQTQTTALENAKWMPKIGADSPS